MTAILKYAPQGVVGDVSKPDETNVEAVFLGATPPTAYGVPVKFDSSGNAIKVVASDAATVFAGILARVAPAISGSGSTDQFGSGGLVPNAAQVQSLVVRGYVTVACTVGTPVRGGQVYMCNNTSGGAVGDLQATSSSNNVALSGVTWAVNGKDSNNITELRIIG